MVLFIFHQVESEVHDVNQKEVYGYIGRLGEIKKRIEEVSWKKRNSKKESARSILNEQIPFW